MMIVIKYKVVIRSDKNPVEYARYKLSHIYMYLHIKLYSLKWLVDIWN